MYAVGFALMMVYSVRNRKRYKISTTAAVVLTLFTYVFGVAGALAMGRIYKAVSVSITGAGDSNVAIFGAVIFCPCMLLILFGLQRLIFGEKYNFRGQMDLLTPGIFMILTCAKFGCSLDGCCYGFVCEHGIYNPKADAVVFPVQICEVATMIVILVLAELIEKNKRFVTGMKYPVTAIMYCAARFGWEFARFYPDERLRYLFLGMSMWQLCCVGVALISVAAIVVLNRRNRKQNR